MRHSAIFLACSRSNAKFGPLTRLREYTPVHRVWLAARHTRDPRGPGGASVARTRRTNHKRSRSGTPRSCNRHRVGHGRSPAGGVGTRHPGIHPQAVDPDQGQSKSQKNGTPSTPVQADLKYRISSIHLKVPYVYARMRARTCSIDVLMNYYYIYSKSCLPYTYGDFTVC